MKNSELLSEMLSECCRMRFGKLAGVNIHDARICELPLLTWCIFFFRTYLGGSIQRALKTNGTERVTLAENLGLQIKDVHVYSKQKQTGEFRFPGCDISGFLSDVQIFSKPSWVFKYSWKKVKQSLKGKERTHIVSKSSFVFWWCTESVNLLNCNI